MEYFVDKTSSIQASNRELRTKAFSVLSLINDKSSFLFIMLIIKSLVTTNLSIYHDWKTYGWEPRTGTISDLSGYLPYPTEQTLRGCKMGDSRERPANVCLAQLVELHPVKVMVGGSIPPTDASHKRRRLQLMFCFCPGITD